MGRPMIEPWEMPWETPWSRPATPEMPEGLTAPRPWQGPAPDVPLDIPGARPWQGPPRKLPWDMSGEQPSEGPGTQGGPLDVPWAQPTPGSIPSDRAAPAPREFPGYREAPLANPFPDKRRCVKEWNEASEECMRLFYAGELKKGYAGFGKDFNRCVRGLVSVDCGGSKETRSHGERNQDPNHI